MAGLSGLSGLGGLSAIAGGSASIAPLSPHFWVRGDAGLLDASDAAVSADATAIKTFVDQTTNARNAVQSTSGLRSTYGATERFAQFNVDQNRWTSFSASALNSRDFSIWVIMEPIALRQTYNESSLQDYHAWAEINDTGSSWGLWFYRGSTGRLGYFRGGFQFSSLKPPSSRCLIGFAGGAAKSTMYLNNSEEDMTVLASISTINGGCLMGNAAGDFPAQGQLIDAFALSRYPTAADLTAIRSYAQSRGVKLSGYTNNLCVDGDSIGVGAKCTLNRNWVRGMGLPSTTRVYNTSEGSISLATLSSGAAARIDPLIDGSARNILVVHAGTNDIALNARTGAQVYSDLTSYVTARKSAGWNKVIVVTMLPRGAGSETERQALNNAIRGGSGLDADAVADVETIAMGAAGENSNTTYFNADAIHPNNTGYAAMAALIGPVVTAQSA